MAPRWVVLGSVTEARDRLGLPDVAAVIEAVARGELRMERRDAEGRWIVEERA